MDRSEGQGRSPDPVLGTIINGKFRVERTIARGGMGSIYYGTQAPLDRPVALKIVQADSVNEEQSQFLKRFLLEASILAKLQHPNVVTLFDYGRIEGARVEMYFIAMEYLKGETLTERLRVRGPLPTPEALNIFRQIARGLREAHARGVVHRDLKPSNIMILPEADGEIVKLVDFGIGKIERSGGEDLTRDGMLVGTPKYMAPEQFDGHSSPASDVYALGMIVYQILTGTTPFSANTLTEFMIAKLQHPIPPLREMNPSCDVGERLENLVYRMLARRPEERLTLDEVFKQLALSDEEVFGASGPRPVGGALPQPKISYTGAGSARRRSLGALQVPYTVVVPQPMVAAITGNPGPGGAVLPPTGSTPRPMARSEYPVSSAKSQRRMLAVGAFLLGVLAVGGLGVWFAKSRPSAHEPASAPTESTSASASALASGSPSASAPGATPTSFVMYLDSVPRGATVRENGRDLGVTPLEIAIDGSAAGAERVFEIQKYGYVPMTITQTTATANVHRTLSLAPETARTVKSPANIPNVGRSPAGSGKAPAPPTPTGESDIRLRR